MGDRPGLSGDPGSLGDNPVDPHFVSAFVDPLEDPFDVIPCLLLGSAGWTFLASSALCTLEDGSCHPLVPLAPFGLFFRALGCSPRFNHKFINFGPFSAWCSTCSLQILYYIYISAYFSAWSLIIFSYLFHFQKGRCSRFSATFGTFRHSRALVCFITMRTWCVGREECSDCCDDTTSYYVVSISHLYISLFWPNPYFGILLWHTLA